MCRPSQSAGPGRPFPFFRTLSPRPPLHPPHFAPIALPSLLSALSVAHSLTRSLPLAISLSLSESLNLSFVLSRAMDLALSPYPFLPTGSCAQIPSSLGYIVYAFPALPLVLLDSQALPLAPSRDPSPLLHPSRSQSTASKRLQPTGFIPPLAVTLSPARCSLFLSSISFQSSLLPSLPASPLPAT
jgi:hypothetical protein